MRLALRRAALLLPVSLLAGCAGGNAPAGSTGPSALPTTDVAAGIVQPDSMRVSINNETTLTVSLVVNDSLVASVEPATCLGCGDDDSVPASLLPPLPWHVEARSPSGRVLVRLDVHAGDVIQTNGYSKGDGARVDLSCGRLDLWSGPPMDGPAPDPGTPGDCRP